LRIKEQKEEKECSVKGIVDEREYNKSAKRKRMMN